MTYDFDRLIDRKNTNAAAMEGFRGYLFENEPLEFPCGDDEVVCLWVADMAFASAPAAIDAMKERLEHPIFGYTAVFDDGLFNAFRDWCEHFYGWAPEQEHFLTSPGVVPALFDLVDLTVGPDEKVLTLTPAYGHFKRAPEHHGRELVTCGLIEAEDGSYTIDFELFESKVADPALRIFFLCHPHNPTGRVWTDAELRQMTELCLANDVMVVSDEIHCDLLRNGAGHTPLAKLFPDSDQIITCMSASKTFNLAGLGLASLVIPNDELRATWIERKSPLVNPISIAAVTGVLRGGHGWLEALQTYLDANLAYLHNRLSAELPEAVFRIPDATYLAWIDLSRHFAEDVDLMRFFAERAGVILEGANMFISDGAGHVRLNVACPRAVLDNALSRIVLAVTHVAA
ncbi:MAG: cystathionine beta-lyase [Verrucomicrobiales bacterium]|jgi:cystathionine beta-lyase